MLWGATLYELYNFINLINFLSTRQLFNLSTKFFRLATCDSYLEKK